MILGGPPFKPGAPSNPSGQPSTEEMMDFCTLGGKVCFSSCLFIQEMTGSWSSNLARFAKGLTKGLAKVGRTFQSRPKRFLVEENHYRAFLSCFKYSTNHPGQKNRNKKFPEKMRGGPEDTGRTARSRIRHRAKRKL